MDAMWPRVLRWNGYLVPKITFFFFVTESWTKSDTETTVWIQMRLLNSVSTVALEHNAENSLYVTIVQENNGK